jgi:Ca2+-binding EF-hand superfamily protein
MKKTFVYTALAVLALGSISSAIAGEKGRHGHHKGKMFEKMDVNSDGKVTKSEFTSVTEERFAKMDINGNGEITKEEAKSHHTNMKEKRKNKNSK